MLKRHLSTSYGMTPDEYRAKWGLPADYPMVAPNYAEARRQLAKDIGLGRKPGARGKAKVISGAKKCIIRLPASSCARSRSISETPDA